MYLSLMSDSIINESIEFESLISSSFAFFSTYLGSNHSLRIVVDKKNDIEKISTKKRKEYNIILRLVNSKRDISLKSLLFLKII